MKLAAWTRTAIFGNTGAEANKQTERTECHDRLIHRIIIDGSWMKDTLLVGGAWVALDEFDNQIGAHTAAFFPLSASMAEAKACLDAV